MGLLEIRLPVYELRWQLVGQPLPERLCSPVPLDRQQELVA